MKKLTFLFCCLVGTWTSFSQFSHTEAIDSVFIEWADKESPGAALGIIQNGNLIYAKGYGMANLEYDLPITANSVFRIASTSKQFTAACIILLAEHGKLKLSDPLSKFFPDFPDYASKITIRQLLNHTSGIRDYLMVTYLKGFRDDDFYTDKEVMKWLIAQEDLNFEPGSEHLYSNSGYWLLGQIVNQVADKSMADFAREEIFIPLGMTDTHFHNDHQQIVKNRASGYSPKDDGTYKISMTTLDMIGDGGIFTTINDIKKWDDAYYDRSVLSDNFWKEMLQPGVLNDGEKLDYASGLSLDTYKGLNAIQHGGAFVGFRAQFVRFPDQKVSIAVFANRADANPMAKVHQVADIVLADKFIVEEQNEVSTKSSKPKFIKLRSKQLKAFEGHYWNEERSLARKIYVKNDTLRYSRSETNESDLVPISKNEFKMINVGIDVSVSFKEDGKKGYTMTFSSTGSEPIRSRPYQPIEYTSEQLKNFAGSYYSKELDVNYHLKLSNEQLVLYIDDTKKSKFDVIKKNTMNNNDTGIYEFEEDNSGTITGFKLAAGRVKNLKFVKK